MNIKFDISLNASHKMNIKFVIAESFPLDCEDGLIDLIYDYAHSRSLNFFIQTYHDVEKRLGFPLFDSILGNTVYPFEDRIQFMIDEFDFKNIEFDPIELSNISYFFCTFKYRHVRLIHGLFMV